MRNFAQNRISSQKPRMLPDDNLGATPMDIIDNSTFGLRVFETK